MIEALVTLVVVQVVTQALQMLQTRKVMKQNEKRRQETSPHIRNM